MSQAEIPVRRPAGCNTAVSHTTILNERNVSEVNIFEIKLSVCAHAQFTVTKYHTVAYKINCSMNSAEQIIPWLLGNCSTILLTSVGHILHKD